MTMAEPLSSPPKRAYSASAPFPPDKRSAPSLQIDQVSSSLANTSLMDSNDAAPMPIDERADCSLLVIEDDVFQRSALRMLISSIANVAGSSPPPTTRRYQSPPNSPPSPGKLGQLTLHVEECEDGEKGWEKLASGAFDIALVDIYLPGVSGLDISWCYQQMIVQGALKPEAQGNSEQQRKTIIIACTSDKDVSREQIERYGIHDLLRKPVRALREAHTIIMSSLSASLTRVPLSQLFYSWNTLHSHRFGSRTCDTCFTSGCRATTPRRLSSSSASRRAYSATAPASSPAVYS